MERDSLVAHGSARFLKERLYDMSDPYTMDVCIKCGNYTVINKQCKSCESDEISTVVIPYCAKLLIQNLQALNIKIKIVPKQ